MVIRFLCAAVDVACGSTGMSRPSLILCTNIATLSMWFHVHSVVLNAAIMQDHGVSLVSFSFRILLVDCCGRLEILRSA